MAGSGDHDNIQDGRRIIFNDRSFFLIPEEEILTGASADIRETKLDRQNRYVRSSISSKL
jgi:hypothetical protein